MPTEPRIRQRAVTPVQPEPKAPTGSGIWGTITQPGSAKYLKMVLFGPPKTGKTRAACSGKGPTLLIEMEPEGDLAISGQPGVDVVRPENWKDLNDLIVGLFTTHRDKYRTVVFDSVTFMFELLGAKEILETLQANKDARRKYLNAGAAVNQLIHDAVRLPMNVVFICQMKADQPDEEAGETPLNPQEGEYPLTLAITPMVYKILAPAVSALGRTYKKVGYDKPDPKKPGTKKSEFWVSFEDFGKSPAGSRIPLPEQVRDLNMDTLLAATQGE